MHGIYPLRFGHSVWWGAGDGRRPVLTTWWSRSMYGSKRGEDCSSSDRASEGVLSLFCQKNFGLSQSIWVTKIPSKVLKNMKIIKISRFQKSFLKTLRTPCLRYEITGFRFRTFGGYWVAHPPSKSTSMDSTGGSELGDNVVAAEEYDAVWFLLLISLAQMFLYFFSIWFQGNTARHRFLTWIWISPGFFLQIIFPWYHPFWGCFPMGEGNLQSIHMVRESCPIRNNSNTTSQSNTVPRYESHGSYRIPPNISNIYEHPITWRKPFTITRTILWFVTENTNPFTVQFESKGIEHLMQMNGDESPRTLWLKHPNERVNGLPTDHLLCRRPLPFFLKASLSTNLRLTSRMTKYRPYNYWSF